MVMLTMMIPSQEQGLESGAVSSLPPGLGTSSTCCGCHKSELQRELGPWVFRKVTLQPLL